MQTVLRSSGQTACRRAAAQRQASSLPGSSARSRLPPPGGLGRDLRWTARRIVGLALYSGGFVALAGCSLWGLTHLHVEGIELGGSLPLQDEQLYNLAEDDSELCWSGKGHGTDPRLGFWVRNAVRAAYIAQHYGSRAASVQVGDSVQTLDAGVLEAEGYLLYAIMQARQQGLDLPDPAVVELESRLANLRERMGGSKGLLAAKISFEQVWDKLQEASKGDDWARRESARAARKAGEVALRLATEQLSGDEAAQEIKSAETWLLRSAKTSLRIPEHALVSVPAQHTSSSWFSRQSTPAMIGSRPVDALLAALTAQPFLMPVDSRSLFATLTSLSALYARNSPPVATQLLTAALALTPPKPAMSEDLPAKVHDSYLAARHALLQTFSGELAMSLNPAADPRLLLLKASQAAKDVSTELQKTGLIAERSIIAAVSTALFGSGEQKAAEHLRHRVQLADRDARTAACTAYYLLGVIHQKSAKQTEALEAYQTAMKIAAGDEDLAQPLTAKADEGGYRRALAAHMRLKDSL